MLLVTEEHRESHGSGEDDVVRRRRNLNLVNIFSLGLNNPTDKVPLPTLARTYLPPTSATCLEVGR